MTNMERVRPEPDSIGSEISLAAQISRVHIARYTKEINCLPQKFSVTSALELEGGQ